MCFRYGHCLCFRTFNSLFPSSFGLCLLDERTHKRVAFCTNVQVRVAHTYTQSARLLLFCVGLIVIPFFVQCILSMMYAFSLSPSLLHLLHSIRSFSVFSSHFGHWKKIGEVQSLLTADKIAQQTFDTISILESLKTLLSRWGVRNQHIRLRSICSFLSIILFVHENTHTHTPKTSHNHMKSTKPTAKCNPFLCSESKTKKVLSRKKLKMTIVTHPQCVPYLYSISEVHVL